ncbi:MAG: GNAT family N-acetyltransferase [Clostridia bacterium]|nr:GNAT family N-acetyltransferase [Clostridia bacterium]
MLKIDFVKEFNDEMGQMLDKGFNDFAKKSDIVCNYTPFTFVAKENDKIIGIITGHSYYKEVHIGDLIVLEEYRNKHIGSKLMAAVEEYFKGKEYKNINLTTYGFQAPEFYKKCGYEVEYIREDKEDPRLTKYFLVKKI